MTAPAPTQDPPATTARTAVRQGIGLLGRFQARLLLVTIVCMAAIGVGAGLAFARGGKPTIGSGVVVVDTDLAYQGGAAAGTGIVLSSSGEVLTNNHVVRGATSVEVVVPGTGHRYSANVVGYDVSADVAVLQLSGASNLKTASLGDSSTLMTGQAVEALGNAGGTGTLTSASGTVTGLARAITVSDDQGGSERLTGLVETNAALQPGDSGGPLLDASGRVIGMDTAGSAGFAFQATAGSDSYAIPINTALRLAKQIEIGQASSDVHVGPTAFLGIEIANTLSDGPFGYGGNGAAFSTGALIAGTVADGPAAAAGLTAGDVITAIDGHAISSPSAIASLIFTERPGSALTVTYTDQTGTNHTATLTLAAGPPQ